MGTDKTRTIDEKLKIIPEEPGCYEFFDRNNTIIYIGKAKNLKRRVTSYFNKDHDSTKTMVMVRQIVDLKYIVVDTEAEALLLENNLIKENRPRYNVMLKDDKTYPYIVVKNEYFPRVYQTRNMVKDGSQYFGPYPNVKIAKVMLMMLREIYKLRICKLSLTPENIAKGKFKVCLQYHIKRCKAPCIGLQSSDEYNKNIAEVKEILKGNVSYVNDLLKKEMQHLSKEMRFEEAQEIKEKYDILENYRSKSTVVSQVISDIDVFSYTDDEKSAYINYMHIKKGAIVQIFTFEYKRRLDETKEELLSRGITEMRDRFRTDAREIIIPFEIDYPLEYKTFFTIPQRGDKKKLLEMSMKNAIQYKQDKQKQSEKLNPEQWVTRILSTMQKDLHLKELPMHIECFDNSNLQGTNPVAACVVFKKAKPSKKDYRHFHIKTVIGANDYDSMREVVGRRYKRMIEEETPLPQLIIIDGGKGQLNAAKEILDELRIADKVEIVGLAKRLEEIFYPGDPVPLVLDKTSETLKIIQQLRDEAHRFGITFHRNLRSKKQTFSELDSIKGIGDQTKKILLKEYKSVKRVKEEPFEELKGLVGDHKANLIFSYFNHEDSHTTGTTSSSND